MNKEEFEKVTARLKGTWNKHPLDVPESFVEWTDYLKKLDYNKANTTINILKTKVIYFPNFKQFNDTYIDIKQSAIPTQKEKCDLCNSSGAITYKDIDANGDINTFVAYCTKCSNGNNYKYQGKDNHIKSYDEVLTKIKQEELPNEEETKRLLKGYMKGIESIMGKKPDWAKGMGL